jgi:hypothetical protein
MAQQLMIGLIHHPDSDDSLDMKRKASEEADTPDSKHRTKKARTESPNEIKVWVACIALLIPYI